ncbi:ribosome biogenesis GTPase YqeH [Tannockella kyphosi]|uniref:ribosome biogenesis GTPase YqeH n=1 Tax=Tannockella kyphosi TaxID=2899121 RepID=UPI002011B015|nr:ribosome biogenesis GTPase YqeH [Tannockella kyphosi]
MTQELKCFGCGAIIQSENENKIGFVPKNATNNEHVLCRRCFRMKNYHELQQTSLTSDDFLNILQTIGQQDCLVVYLIDVFDFNGSLIQGLTRHVNNNDILVIGNKRDILPKSLKDRKIEHWIRRQLKEHNVKPVDVLLTSGIKNYNLDALMESIHTYRKNRNVYVVGVTNVGKSSMINALLTHYTKDNTHLITTSEFPGTTLDLIEIPLDETTSLYDSPGIINVHQMAHLVKPEHLKTIVPKTELRPKGFQLSSQQTLYFGGLARMDFVKGDKSSFTCYFPRHLNISRCKLENADKSYLTNHMLEPKIEEIETTVQMESHDFTLGKHKSDIVISGLGFISVESNNAKITIKAPKGVGVFLREALI